MIYFRQFFPLSPGENYEIIGGMMLTGKTKVFGGKKTRPSAILSTT
jgi:hypothetical protein